MKKIFIPILVLVLLISTGTSVLAWDVEDPCVVANEDMHGGRGVDYDTSTSEWHWNGDGYNLYRDDASDTGNLDYVAVWLKGGMGNWFRDESPDTYYWATEPRGRDFTKADILSGVPGKGLEEAPGLQKPFNPNSQAGNNAGKK